jgi:hypothetical protein
MRMGIPAARTNHSYANAAAITAIPPNQRQDGDEAFNADTGVGYHFDADAVAGGLTPDAGTGRWIADATVAGAVAATDLASTANALGASLVGIEDAAGLYASAETESALIELRGKRTVTITHADLTEATNNTAQAINIGATLPANARITGVDMRALTVFTGGSVSAVTCDVGTSGDVDALIDGADLQTTAVDGGPATMPQGIRPNKTFVTAAAQLIATFYPDPGHALLALTAGSVVIDVSFVTMA